MRGAVPPPGVTLTGTALWGVVMGSSAWLSLTGVIAQDWQSAAKIRFVAALFTAGAAIAFPIGLYLARLLSFRRPKETVFAAFFTCLAICTIGFTSALYALQYRLYYAEWHDSPFTMRWGYEMVFTTLAALYQFAVMGLRLYFPVGFVALLIASLWFTFQRR